MAKKKRLQEAPEKQPFSFQWEGVEHKEGDRYKVVIPRVGLEEEVELSPRCYYYGFPDNFIDLSFSWVNWCCFAVTINQRQGEAELMWWPSDFYEGEDGKVHFGHHLKNPYRLAGHRDKIWSIPVDIKPGLILEKGTLIPSLNTASPLASVVPIAGTQLHLF